MNTHFTFKTWKVAMADSMNEITQVRSGLARGYLWPNGNLIHNIAALQHCTRFLFGAFHLLAKVAEHSPQGTRPILLPFGNAVLLQLTMRHQDEFHPCHVQIFHFRGVSASAVHFTISFF